jgi:diaminopimelate epimerase
VANGAWPLWQLQLDTTGTVTGPLAVLSMGNPHAVWVVADVDATGVEQLGPLIECHAAFPARVNVGFMQVLDAGHVRLRVFERGVGETLACGTGACAAAVTGVRLGLLRGPVTVDTRGGPLVIDWAETPAADAAVLMSGPATLVFEGRIDLPTL